VLVGEYYTYPQTSPLPKHHSGSSSYIIDQLDVEWKSDTEKDGLKAEEFSEVFARR